MKIEEQVCSIELSTILKNLGIKKESFFYWATALEIDNIYAKPVTHLVQRYSDQSEFSQYYPRVLRQKGADVIVDEHIGAMECETKQYKIIELYSAFSLSELGEIINLNEINWTTFYSHHLGFWNWEILDFDIDSEEYPTGFKVAAQGSGEYETEEEARAELLKYLIENKIINVDSVNEIGELANSLELGYGEIPKGCKVESLSASLLPFRCIRTGNCKTCGKEVKNIFPYGGEDVNDTSLVDNKELYCRDHRPHETEYDDCVQWDGEAAINSWKNTFDNIPKTKGEQENGK